MYIIESSDYPKIRDWDTKVFSMPKIPRSSKGYAESLKMILNALKEKNHITRQFTSMGAIGKTH